MEGSSPRTPGSPNGLRCSACGALVTPDAEWCGQCLTPLNRVSASREELAASIGIKISEEPVAARPEGNEGSAPTSGSTPKVRLTWPCPMCEHDNDIELNRCERCGTPFAALMKSDEPAPQVEPREALKWSLIYPGLGHRKAGRAADGVARGTLFALSLVLLIVVVLSGAGSTGQLIMVSLYLITTVAVYVGSAAEAYRIAQGGEPFVSSRTLLWVTVGLLLVSIGLLAVTVTLLGRS